MSDRKYDAVLIGINSGLWVFVNYTLSFNFIFSYILYSTIFLLVS